MRYLLSKKVIGASLIEEVFEFSTPALIRDFLFCEEFGYIYLSEDSMGQIDLEGNVIFPWFTGFTNPSSMCYLPDDKNCLVVENEGKMVSAISLESHSHAEVLGGKAIQKDLNRYFINSIPDQESKTAIAVTESNYLYWLAASISRCFGHVASSLKVIAGDGRAGYSLTTAAALCHLNAPEGMVAYKDALYICDTGNSCLRCLKDGAISLIAGKPLAPGNVDGPLGTNLLDSPSKIRLLKGKAYFLDKGLIKRLSFATKEVVTVPGVEKVTEITEGPQGDLYFLTEM